ncbi:hypothetical protein ACTHGU_04750 [Chitinophagaceae bacterium MMS25-I14]
MEQIKTVLKKEKPSLEELMYCFELVKNNGDIVVIKLDGERKEKGYTAFITFPLSKKKEMIRVDEDNLETTLITVLSMYVM